MANIKVSTTVNPLKLPANDPKLAIARTAYTEVALGIRPNYDRQRTQQTAINYERTRLALFEHMAQHGNLPSWKRNERFPEWLAQALRQVKRDFRGRY